MYWKLAGSLVASAVVMHLISYSEIETLGHLHLSLSNGYMTLMMVAAMGLIMLVAMRSMLTNVRLNAALYAGFAALFVGAFLAGREQALVGDDAFLRSMIPHHSRAVLVCSQASISEPAIERLCDGIVKTQLEEIAIMEALMREPR